jgi:hypothetical protein
MSSYDDIQATLDVTLNGISDLPSLVFENLRPEDQPFGSEFIWTQFEPIAREPSARGPDPLMRYSGFFVVNICIPQNTGNKRTRALVDKVLATFKGANHVSHDGFHLTIESSRQETGFKLENHFCVPVTIDWYCYAT